MYQHQSPYQHHHPQQQQFSYHQHQFQQHVPPNPFQILTDFANQVTSTPDTKTMTDMARDLCLPLDIVRDYFAKINTLKTPSAPAPAPAPASAQARPRPVQPKEVLKTKILRADGLAVDLEHIEFVSPLNGVLKVMRDRIWKCEAEIQRLRQVVHKDVNKVDSEEQE